MAEETRGKLKTLKSMVVLILVEILVHYYGHLPIYVTPLVETDPKSRRGTIVEAANRIISIVSLYSFSPLPTRLPL
jgi:hypothetical protein